MSMTSSLSWQSVCPRKSGWYWIKGAELGFHPIICEVEGRDASDDGWVRLGADARFYLTPGARDEGGDEKQSEAWMKWSWAGPIPEPTWHMT